MHFFKLGGRTASQVEWKVSNQQPQLSTRHLLPVLSRSTICLAISLLLDYGADVDAIDSRGWTALHLVATGSEVIGEELRLLTRKSKDVDGLNQDGDTPLYLLVGNLKFGLVIFYYGTLLRSIYYSGTFCVHRYSRQTHITEFARCPPIMG